MSTHRRRAHRPTVRALEGRLLLSGDALSARWLGQDAHDLVGPAAGSDGVQDIHVVLDGLPADRAIATADVEGLGGGQWLYQGSGTRGIALDRSAGSTSADLYLDPYQTETGRPFWLALTYDDGSTGGTWFDGGAADPNLRMPAAVAQLGWIGQDGHDKVGPGPSVGPDGLQDVHLTLGNLPPDLPITSVTFRSSSGRSWAFGVNPAGFDNAAVERLASDPTRADVYLAPSGDTNGQTFTATILYANGKSDSATTVVGGANPTLAQVATADPLPVLRDGVTATWVGQDGQDLTGPGSARLAVSGLPSGRTVVAAALSDPTRSLWVYRRDGNANFYGDPWANNLAFQSDGPRADVAFSPLRDESGAMLTLRVEFDDGTIAVARVVAGSTDPGLLAPGPDASSVVAHPGDDLNDLANRYGTVRLSAGVYPLNSPLVLNRPVAILADPGVTLQFSQADGDPAWSTAIKIHAGHTTLDGFAVRFATPIRWADGVSYGPALIGTTDNLDSNPGTLKVALAITRLDLQSPPVPSGYVEAPRLIRLATGVNGRIEGNTLKGGTVEFLGGPWTIANNEYLGTVPNTSSSAVFSGHNTHDVTLRNNSAQPVGPSGKTWRFLVLTGTGTNDVIADNTVVGIGPRDDDTRFENAPEIILTESYSLKFEGSPTRISADGQILQIPPAQGGPAAAGDMVAILSGPSAGQYRRIAQALGPQTYLLETPLPAGSYAISIASGFVDETFQGNTLDARGSAGAGDLVLVGNHFGTKVLENHFLGGADSFHIAASPTESPDVWGWSHAPFLGATIRGNILEDSVRGGQLAVEHSSAIKSTIGRVYFSGSLTDNTVVYSPAFLAARGSGQPGIVVGQAGSLDPDELRLTASGNVFEASGADALTVVAGRVVNPTVGAPQPAGIILPPAVGPKIPASTPLPAPTGLRLVNDTGLSAQDRETMDGHLQFDPVAGAVSYEYMVSNGAGYLPINTPSGFLPAGITPASNTIWLRAIDAQGGRSAEASVSFFLDNTPPITSIPFLRPSSDTGISVVDRVTSATSPTFDVTGEASDTMILLRNGVEIGRRLGTGPIVEPAVLPAGVYGYSVTRFDAAGNGSVSATVTLTVDTTPPPAVANLSASSDGRVTFTATGPDDRYEYRVGTSGAFVPIGAQTSFTQTKSTSPADRVTVRAIDRAGNIGPESSAAIGGPVSPGPAPTPTPAPVTSPGAPAVPNPAPAPTPDPGPSGTWIGQDGTDYVGTSPATTEPDGFQDIHILLTGLRADRAIAFVDIQGLGGSQWQFGGPNGPWKAAIVRAPGSTTADLYLQPDRAETGRPFSVSIRYDDGTSASFWVNGGPADPSLKVVPPSASSKAPESSAPVPGPITPAKPAPKKPGRLKAIVKAKPKARPKPKPKAHPVPNTKLRASGLSWHRATRSQTLAGS